MKKNHFDIPPEVEKIAKTLEKAKFEAYFIGGCVRDLILGKKPKDWDITTNAVPDQIIALFPKTFYENTYGTVGVVDEESKDETLRVVEVTPYRLETKYSDNRRPDTVHFSNNIEDDLKRRDFTINAIAVSSKGHVVDLYGGQKDIEDRVLRAVGKPEERFREDALRMMRAVRISTELCFTINTDTEKAIIDNAELLKNISKERIRDEFARIIMSESPATGIEILFRLGLLKYIVPELETARGIEQPQAHKYDVWEHSLRSLQHSADKKWPFHVRLATLFHDIGKPSTQKRVAGQWTFYGHEVVGAKITKKILNDLKFPKKLIDDVTTLVRWHMFFSDTEQITLSAVRRIIASVGKEMIWDLVNVRICDRVGTGRPKEQPYRLRKYKSMIDEALHDAVTVGMLKIDGKRIMELNESAPGPKIGYILHALLEEVLENPQKNTPKYLEGRSLELNNLDEAELKKLSDEGKIKKDEVEESMIDEIRKKHGVN